MSKIVYGIHTGPVSEMKDIYTSYIESLKETNIEVIRTEKYLKMHLKDLLSKEIDSIVFENSVQWNKSAKVYSSTYSEKVIDAAISKTLADASGNMKNISKTDNIVRSAVLQAINSVEKSFISTQKTHDNDIPTELFSLIKWVLGGHTDLHGVRNTELITIAKNICNTIMYNVKSERQVAYKPTNDKVAFKSRYENPQVIGLGITVRQFGRKKGIVNLLHPKGDCISNDRCILIGTGIANEVIYRK